MKKKTKNNLSNTTKIRVLEDIFREDFIDNLMKDDLKYTKSKPKEKTKKDIIVDKEETQKEEIEIPNQEKAISEDKNLEDNLNPNNDDLSETEEIDYENESSLSDNNQSDSDQSDNQLPLDDSFNEIVKENIDVSSILETVNNSVINAEDVFNQNIKIREQINKKLKQLDKKEEILEQKKIDNYNKINSYKEEVFKKIDTKKSEIEDKISELKETQEKLLKEKERFEEYKINEIERIKEIKINQKKQFKKEQEEIDRNKNIIESQLEEINKVKDQLQVEKLKYDSDKCELANNLLKFNSLVNDFTSTMDKFNQNKPE